METVTRNFKVRGMIQGLFTPEGGTPLPKNIANMQVELWHKAPMQAILLGSGLTSEEGEFIVDFKVESPTPMIEDGKISDIFLKVYYDGKMIIGDPD